MRVEVSTINWTIRLLTSKFAFRTSKVSLKGLVDVWIQPAKRGGSVKPGV